MTTISLSNISKENADTIIEAFEMIPNKPGSPAFYGSNQTFTRCFQYIRENPEVLIDTIYVHIHGTSAMVYVSWPGQYDRKLALVYIHYKLGWRYINTEDDYFFRDESYISREKINELNAPLKNRVWERTHRGI